VAKEVIKHYLEQVKPDPQAGLMDQNSKSQVPNDKQIPMTKTPNHKPPA